MSVGFLEWLAAIRILSSGEAVQEEGGEAGGARARAIQTIQGTRRPGPGR